MVTDAEEFGRRKQCIFPKLGLSQLKGKGHKLAIGLFSAKS